VNTLDWETIKEALTRLMVLGQSKQELKRALCRAMAQGKINVQLTTVAKPDLNLRDLTFDYRHVSRRLSPSDIDWSHSKPSSKSKAWQAPPLQPFQSVAMYGASPENIGLIERTIEVIWVCSSQVTKIFLAPQRPITPLNFSPLESPKPAVDRPSARSPESKSRRGHKVLSAEAAIRALWPEGGPPSELAPYDRNQQITAWQKENRVSESSKRTIQRALELFRSQIRRPNSAK
jgi:hypothetical protein